MQNSPVTKSPRLLNRWALLAVAVVVGILLWATLQNEDVFQPNGQELDEVSAGYAEVLLGAYPEDQKLRTQLLDLLLQLNHFDRAQKHLDEWPSPDPVLKPFYQLALDAQVMASKANSAASTTTTTTATAAAPVTDADREALAGRFRAFDYKALPDAQLQTLSRLALASGVPAVAADSFVELSKRQPEQATSWLEQAAKWYLASEQPGKAAAIYVQLLEGSQDPALRQQYLVAAFKDLVATDRGEEAIELLAREIKAQPDLKYEPALLDLAVDVAVGHARPDLAEQFFVLWRKEQPDTPEVMRKELQKRLAFGDLAGARAAGEQLLVHEPEDIGLLKQLALIAEWQGDIPGALQHWVALFKLHNEPGQYEHAWRLALQGFEFDQGIPLLADIMHSRALTDTELDALIYAEESRGTPEHAEHWLRSYLRHYPKHRLAHLRLLQNLENTGQYDERLVAWQNFSAHFKLTMAERLDWVSNHLKHFDNESAWQVIDAVDTSTVKEVEYWETRSELAWTLERDDDLRQSLEQLLVLKGHLNSGDESVLINLYRQSDPQKALRMMVDSWHRTFEPEQFVYALQLAQDLQEWALVATLLDEAKEAPQVADRAEVWAARGALAAHNKQPDEAIRLYQEGLQRYPHDNLFRERLLWLYVDLGRSNELKPLLQQWRPLARRDSTLWLPFAAANQQLGRSREALAWYRLYLKGNDVDWLIQAAYADALESAGQVDRAQRLRLRLTREITPETVVATPQGYATWLRLLSTSYSSRKAQGQALLWQDGSKPMLQLWFDQMLARLDTINQLAQKGDWLAWARSRGLRIERADQIQEILSGRDRNALEQLIAGNELDPAQKVEALTNLGRPSQALALSLSELGDEQTAAMRDQLRQQAIGLTEATPQGIQFGWQQQNYGGPEFRGPRVSMARYLGDDWYTRLDLEQGDYNGDSLDSSALGTERNVELTLQRQLSDGVLKLMADTSQRDDDDRNGLGISRSWQVTPGDTLEVGGEWQRKSEDTGLMRALGQQSGAWVGGAHRYSARDLLSWNLGQRWFETREGDDLGNGQALRVEYVHTLQFAGPNWELRSGLDYQHNSLDNRNLAHLASSRGGAIDIEDLGLDDPDQLRPDDLLPDRYGQLYIGSSWRRGFPGALNRTRGQYTWLLDVNAGWQWIDNTVNYGFSTGIGMEVFGDDELALTMGYQSAPEGGGGESGGTVGVSYSLRFGR